MIRRPGLFLCTDAAFARPDLDGELCPVDVVTHFDVESYRAGAPATRVDPAEPDEWEFAVTLVELDGEPETPGPITDAERIACLVWFMEHGHDRACEKARDAMADEPVARRRAA